MRKLLIYRLGSLGDTVIAIPALRLVARAFPDAERRMLTDMCGKNGGSNSMTALLEHTGLIHDYIEYPVRTRQYRAIMQVVREVREYSPDAVVYLTDARGNWKTRRDVMFFRLCGVKTIYGIPSGNDRCAAVRIGDAQYEQRGARLLRCLGGLREFSKKQDIDGGLGLNEHEFESARWAMGRVAFGGRILAASIGTTRDVNDWGEENWRSLFRRLAKYLSGWTVLMVGSDDEFARSNSILSDWRGPSVNLCGKLSVRTSAAAIALSDMFIGHDSGPLHLAAAVGTPCVGIFSSRNLPGEWFPHGSQHKVFYKELECQGCRLDVCRERDKACIRSIKVEDVARAVLELTSSRG